MDQLDEWMELDRPRGWSMQHGHRRRLMPAEGDDFVRCRGRSTVKRTLASGKRWQPLEKNKSHKQQVRLWWEMRSAVLDQMVEEDYNGYYDWVSEDELDLASVDDWEVSSAADTASTAASTVEVMVPCGGAKGGARAWELALEQAAVVAKRFQVAKEESAKAERRQRRAKTMDPEAQSLAQHLHQHRIKLLCPELASRQHDAFEEFRMKFLQDFGSSIGAGLQSCYQGEVELRCAPMSKNLQSRFLSCKEKQPEQLCPVLHGTEDRNLPSIYQKGLLVPTGQNNVRVLNGSSHGKGIYTAKTQNTALSFGFSKGLSRPLLICGALDDAVPLPAPLRCGNHFITAESASVRHVGDAIVVFDESKLLPLFVASSPGILPPLKPGPATAPAAPPAAAPAPAVVLQAQVAGTAAEKRQKRIGNGPITRVTTTAKTTRQLTMAFLSRRAVRRRRP